MSYGRNNYPARKDSDNDEAFDVLRIYVPKSFGVILKSKSEQKNLPISRLVTMALDNEMEDPENAFNYDSSFLNQPYVPDSYFEESKRIYDFIEKLKSPLSRDMLMMCRRDMGIMKRSEFLLGFRQLIETGMIEEYRPKRTAFKNFDENYKVVRTKSLKAEIIKRNRYKKLESV